MAIGRTVARSRAKTVTVDPNKDSSTDVVHQPPTLSPANGKISALPSKGERDRFRAAISNYIDELKLDVSKVEQESDEVRRLLLLARHTAEAVQFLDESMRLHWPAGPCPGWGLLERFFALECWLKGLHQHWRRDLHDALRLLAPGEVLRFGDMVGDAARVSRCLAEARMKDLLRPFGFAQIRVRQARMCEVHSQKILFDGACEQVDGRVDSADIDLDAIIEWSHLWFIEAEDPTNLLQQGGTGYRWRHRVPHTYSLEQGDWAMLYEHLDRMLLRRAQDASGQQLNSKFGVAPNADTCAGKIYKLFKEEPQRSLTVKDVHEKLWPEHEDPKRNSAWQAVTDLKKRGLLEVVEGARGKFRLSEQGRSVAAKTLI